MTLFLAMADPTVDEIAKQNPLKVLDMVKTMQTDSPTVPPISPVPKPRKNLSPAPKRRENKVTPPASPMRRRTSGKNKEVDKPKPPIRRRRKFGAVVEESKTRNQGEEERGLNGVQERLEEQGGYEEGERGGGDEMVDGFVILEENGEVVREETHSDSQETPEKPESPDIPERPEEVEKTEKSGVPAVPDKPDKSGVPAVPDKPGVPAVPEKPDKPGVSAVPEKPDKPGVPAVPAVPEKPDKPGVSAVPEKPDKPGVPAAPDKPEKTDTVRVPERPEKPVSPVRPPKPERHDLPAKEKPKRPELPAPDKLKKFRPTSPTKSEDGKIAEGVRDSNVLTNQIADNSKNTEEDIPNINVSKEATPERQPTPDSGEDKQAPDTNDSITRRKKKPPPMPPAPYERQPPVPLKQRKNISLRFVSSHSVDDPSVTSSWRGSNAAASVTSSLGGMDTTAALRSLNKSLQGSISTPMISQVEEENSSELTAPPEDSTEHIYEPVIVPVPLRLTSRPESTSARPPSLESTTSSEAGVYPASPSVVPGNGPSPALKRGSTVGNASKNEVRRIKSVPTKLKTRPMSDASLELMGSYEVGECCLLLAQL